MSKFDITIIGSGLGSLLCGYILSREGLSVGILEKHSQPGGNLQNFTRHGHAFDTGMHYIGSMAEGQTLYRYWKFAGLTDKLKIHQMDLDGFDIISLGKHDYPLAQGFHHYIERLAPFFPSEKKSIVAFIDRIQQISKSFPLYNLEFAGMYPGEVQRSQNAHHFFSGLTADPKLAGVLAGNNFLYAGDPSRTPLYIAALINHSFISSAWRLVNGSRQIAEILIHGIRNMGGSVLTGKEVIRADKNDQEFRIQTQDRDTFFSRILISGIHPSSAVGILAPGLLKKSYTQRLLNLESTVSSFILYLVFKPGSFPYLNHNIHYFSDENVWTSESSCQEKWPRHFLLYTPLHDPSETYARTAIVLTYMQFSEVKKWEHSRLGQRGDEYLAFKSSRTEKLLKLVEKKFPGFMNCIAFTEASTPLTYRDYTGTPEGSLYGIRKDCNHSLLTTVLPKTKVPGLFFTGQNTGLHGALGVTIGAVSSCGEILGLEYLMNKIRKL